MSYLASQKKPVIVSITPKAVKNIDELFLNKTETNPDLASMDDLVTLRWETGIKESATKESLLSLLTNTIRLLKSIGAIILFMMIGSILYASFRVSEINKVLLATLVISFSLQLYALTRIVFDVILFKLNK